MIDLSGIVGIPFLERSRFTGSEKVMCFVLEKQSAEDGKSLRAAVWPGPYCFEKTPEEKKRSELFPFTEEGLSLAVEWMNGQSQLPENQKIC